MLVRPATLSEMSCAEIESADWPLMTTDVSLAGRANAPPVMLTGNPSVPRPSAVSVNVPPPRKAARS